MRNSSDIKTIVYLIAATGLFFFQWYSGFHWVVYVLSLWMSICVAVIAHNVNHTPIWRSRFLNQLTGNWITLLYGFPSFAWKPTHNTNHHRLNNREEDYTITYRISEKNNLLTLLSYPTISSYYQQIAIKNYLRQLFKKDRREFWLSILQFVVLITFVAVTLIVDWRKSLLFVIIPHQVALFTIMIFNYIQHVHADEESDYNHSRNFVSRFTNYVMFNNGYHTIHHLKANLHWSALPEEHRKIAHLIDKELNQPTIIGYLFKTYILSPLRLSGRQESMRLLRKQRQGTAKFKSLEHTDVSVPAAMS